MSNEDDLRRARKMWSRPFPDLFTQRGDLRSNRDLIAGLTALAAIVSLALVFIILAGCSGDYLREKGGVATDLHKYCLDNPRDSACQGRESK